MWLPTLTGKVAAEYPLDIHGGGNISPYLLNRPNPYAEAIKAIAPALKEYLAQKKADEIANQYLNMENPPRAEAIDGTYDPQLAFRQGLNSQTSPQATAPNTGGERAYKADVLYRSLLNEQADRKNKDATSMWRNKVYEAQANKYNADAEAPDSRTGRYPVTLSDGTVVSVTGNEAANMDKSRTRAAQQDSIEKIDKDLVAWTGHHLSDLNNSIDARNNPDGSATITLANKSQVTIPADALQSVRDRYARLQSRNAGAEMYRSKVQGEQPPLQEPDLPSAQKQLDAATAKEILAEAGGDKDKARQIARERGYSF